MEATQQEVAAPCSMLLKVGRPPSGSPRLMRSCTSSRCQVPAEFGHDHPGMHRDCSDALGAESPVEFSGKEDVRGLRLPVGLPLIVVPLFEMGIVEVHVPQPMTRGTQIDDSSGGRRAKGRDQEAGQEEVADMVRCQLKFPASGGSCQLATHQAGVVDQDVEDFVFGQEAFGTIAHTVREK